MLDIEELLSKILWCQLESIGFFDKKTFVPQPPYGYEKWFEETLCIFERRGYLKKSSGSYQVNNQQFDINALWKQWNPDQHAGIKLIDRALKKLPEILSGKIAATDVIFPQGSMDQVELVYKGNEVADFYNAQLADVVVTYVKEHSGVKIFEIGAGTGGTSTMLFEKLKEFPIQSYCYTDLSKAFLLHAEKTFREPYLTYMLFDVEQPIANQEIVPGSYDIVVAANVLHATRDIRQTLRNAKALLKKNGMLLLNEIATNSIFTHLTFGLLDGWWRYEDSELRIPGCPGLYPKVWKEVLESEGFFDVCLLPPINKEQQVISAKSNGVVRQKKVKKEIEASVPVIKETSNLGVVDFVKTCLGDVIKLAPEKIDLKTPFEKYGIDSILQVSFIQELEKEVGELSKTILFEHTTTQELADYLEKERLFRIRKIVEPSTNTKVVKPLPKTITKQEVAIIGMSGRYPMSPNLDEFWGHLVAGKNCLSQAPSTRFISPLVESSSTFDKVYGGFLEDIEGLDYELFGVKLEQLDEMVPELRLLLEVVWETFESGGYVQKSIDELQQREQLGIGLFVGNMYNQYFWQLPSLKHAQLCSNGTDWHLANHISHFFNLTGPSLALNTACSSSLYAIHLACESLLQNSCSMAIAGGVNLTHNFAKYELLERARFLGHGNQSCSFGVSDGLIPGEGVGTVLLKSLAKAIKDNDPIYGVIKSSFVNHSGGRQIYTAPDPKQQAELINKSIERSGIDPCSISYIEAAANGSNLGDSVEVVAIKQALEKKIRSCALGSVKSNLGHLEAASGVAQLHKVLLQMKHRMLVPTLNVESVNPNIKLENTPFYLQKKTNDWRSEIPRCSMINSFGAGGAYANLIIEEYVQIQQTFMPSRKWLFVFSAKTEWSLQKYFEKLIAFLETNPNLPIGDVARSLYQTYHDFEKKRAFTASSRKELLQKLQGSKCDDDPLSKEWLTGKNMTVDFSGTTFCALPSYAFDHTTSDDNATVTLQYDDPYLEGHQVEGRHMVAGAIFLSMATRFEEVSALKKFTFKCPVVVELGQQLELKLSPVVEGEFQVLFRVASDGIWKEASSGQFIKSDQQLEKTNVKNLKQGLKGIENIDVIYQSTSLLWGDLFRTITKVYLGKNRILAQVNIKQSDSVFPLNPLITNSAYLAMLYLIRDEKSYLPFYIQEIHFESIRDVSWIDVRLVKSSDELLIFDVDAIHEDQIVARYKGYTLKRNRQKKPENYVKAKLESLLNQEVPSKSNIMELGLNSSDLMQLTQEMERELGIELNATLFFEYPTLQELSRFLETAQPTHENFIELIHLNAPKEGRAIFWIHGGFGGVENYQAIAKEVERPFYGIQAKGYHSKKQPLHTIPEMAAYYVKIIRSRQPQGPYDLGGFSLGGILAYEVACQLQQIGEEVNSIIMVDAPDHTRFHQAPSVKTLMLQAINSISSSRVSCEKLNLEQDDETFFKALLKCFKGNKTDKQLRAATQQHIKIQQAFQFEGYHLKALLQPIQCRYFRNASGSFFGGLESFFVLPEDRASLDHTTYWAEWKKKIPDLELIDVPSKSHMTILSDPESLEIITEFCHQFYASHASYH